MGTTVAVLMMTGAELEAASLLPAGEEAAPEDPDPAVVGAAVSVTVTVDSAVVTVTVTGAQLPDPATPLSPDDPLAPADAAAPDEAGRTVMYFVDVLVPVMVVVGPVSEAPADSDSPGKVA